MLQLDAVAVILAHNHPGNTLRASDQDIAITNQLREALGSLAIKIYDHIIVGADQAISLYQEGIIPADYQTQAGLALINLYESEENGYER
ncbi:MAG: JAB domain-containing protein [Hungatella sp.]|uniref:JAB domain-containing protein n=1 Tax=Hungatella sp. TaxID=2613924 RepID=UPI0039953903